MNDMKNKEKERQRPKRPKAQSNKQPKGRVAEGDRWLEGSERDGEADFASDVGRRTVGRTKPRHHAGSGLARHLKRGGDAHGPGHVASAVRAWSRRIFSPRP
ncbi:predicted protein [Coccidioides posadasii str. Silveira]|uniref:Predicted protein n=1 Tax=Coccidioides posadasii (strain RMSCC 757 / Silveira) TaxID=443226 RepID=E9CSF4_COCPS|nr:predicted protein [Coccidioides posadasii str. Silveira]